MNTNTTQTKTPRTPADAAQDLFYVRQTLKVAKAEEKQCTSILKAETGIRRYGDFEVNTNSTTRYDLDAEAVAAFFAKHGATVPTKPVPVVTVLVSRVN